MTQVIFSKIVYRQIISLINHCITIPVGQKFTYTKLTMRQTACKIPGNYVMALEASDRLIDIIWVNWRCTCGCISRPTFKPSASLLDIKRNQPRPQKINWNLHKSGSSLGAISKCPRVPRLSVQTIVRKYKYHSSHHTAQEGDAFCLREMSVLWCKKCKSIPEQQQRTLWRCWRKQVQKYL